MPTTRFFTVSLFTIGLGVAVFVGCEPRKTAKTGGTAAATATTTGAPTATPTPTATTIATAAPTPTPTATATAAPTTTSPPPAGTWPIGALPGIDPNVVADWAKGIGLQVPAGAVPGAAAGDPIDAALKASAAKNAPGYTPIGSVGRADLKQGEPAGMPVQMAPGKCYVIIAVGGAGATTLTLNLSTTPPAPLVVVATDSGPTPSLGSAGKQQLCPPIAATMRANVTITQGAGKVAVQALEKTK